MYAALDAFVCLEIFHKLHSLAKEKDLQPQLEILFREAMGSKDAKKVQKVKTAKVKEKPENVPISHPPRLHSESIAPSQLRIVCDDMLQGLCKKLRLFGVDCLALENGQDHMGEICLCNVLYGSYLGCVQAKGLF